MPRLSSVRALIAAGLSVVLLAAGCDSAPTPLTLTTEAAPPAQTYHVRADGGLDLVFEPVKWSEGQYLAVSTSDVSVQSTAGPSQDHTLSWSAPASMVQRVVGVLGGQVQAVFDPGSGAAGGQTSVGPTSIHYVRHCDSQGCSTAIEYDYERSGPDGSGTAVWSQPDGAAVLVDHLRFEVADHGKADRLAVVSPEPLQLAQ